MAIVSSSIPNIPSVWCLSYLCDHHINIMCIQTLHVKQTATLGFSDADVEQSNHLSVFLNMSHMYHVACAICSHETEGRNRGSASWAKPQVFWCCLAEEKCRSTGHPYWNQKSVVDWLPVPAGSRLLADSDHVIFAQSLVAMLAEFGLQCSW